MDGASPVLAPEIAGPSGHNAEKTKRITALQDRNAIMLANGFGVTAARSAYAIATAVLGGDHFIYLSCRLGSIGSSRTMPRGA